MQVFLSYCRKNEAIANLLAYILEMKGIKCLYDRRLHPALPFDQEIKEMISKADIMIVLLTKESSVSAWVHQEIGYAIAKSKLIWPIALENDIHPEGMISSTQFFSLFDWSDPGRTIDGLIETMSNPSFVTGVSSPIFDSQEIYSRQLDRVITGKKERTKFVISRLTELLNISGNLEIFSQAAFSTFGVSDDPDYPVPGIHNKEYMDLLLKEKALFNELVHKGNVTFKLILWPFRAYDKRHLDARFRSLISWLRENLEATNIDYVCSKYQGPNRLIVKNYFSLEGFKTHNESGYEMNIVKSNTDDFLDALIDFNYTFNQAKEPNSSKQKVIDDLITIQRKMFSNG